MALAIINKIKKAPDRPGVYFFKDRQNKILYIGKAKNLKSRLKYYLKPTNLKVQSLIKAASKLEWLITDSEAEAILKESELIKTYDPPFNHLLRDDTNFFYIIFTTDIFPKIIITHQPQKFSYQKIIGPFVEGSSLRRILKILRPSLKFCTCKKEHQGNCLNSSLDLCFGVCCKKDSQFDQNLLNIYKHNLELLEQILLGNFKKLKKDILDKIKFYLKENKIQQARDLKNTYESIKKIESQVHLIKEENVEEEIRLRKVLIELKRLLRLKEIPKRIEAYDISHLAGKYKVGIMVTFINGKYIPSLKRKFRIKTILTADDPRMIYEVISRRLKHKEWGLPDIILVDGGKVQRKFAEKAVKETNLPIEVISFAKPREEIYYKNNYPPLKISQQSTDFQNFIRSLDKAAHKNVLKYHKDLREKLNYYKNDS